VGMTKINDKSVVTPAAEMKVSELKALAAVPEHDRLYDRQGRVLDDNETVPTDHAEYGVAPDWERGQS
jgi:hypothetical protein